MPADFTARAHEFVLDRGSRDDGRRLEVAAAPVRAPAAATRPATIVSSARREPVRRPLRLPKMFTTGLGLALLVSALVTVGVLWLLGGWRYYWIPLDVRAYTDLHPLLRPSGAVGRTLGVTGLSLMVVMHAYSLRKRLRLMRNLGSITWWLEFHIFCGVLGPVLVTLHTSFKFNGLISVAYWAMVVVVASGFVGRYLYVRIPRSIRGRELSHDEVLERARELKEELQRQGLPAAAMARISSFEAAQVPASEQETTWLGLLLDGVRTRLRLLVLRRTVRRASPDHQLAHETVRLIAERASLLRRIVYLKKTKRLFDLWRVYHKPLAILMAVIVAVHVGIVWYFGYAFGGG